MHVDTEMSYHSADLPGAQIFDGFTDRRPRREAATRRMSSQKFAALLKEKVI